MTSRVVHTYMKTVRIYGSARNAREGPKDLPDGVEVWLCNSTTTNKLRCPHTMGQWTRWFNFHSKAHMVGTYPSAYQYYQTEAAGRPIYLLRAQPDVPTSVSFPREKIQQAFATAKGPNRYFTCSVCWLIAFAIVEGFERIELWGFELRDTKPGSAFAWERPCVAYWMQQAVSHGVEIAYQAAIEKLLATGKLIPGDPDTYDGPLYGYDTKPEVGWDSTTQSFKGE